MIELTLKDFQILTTYKETSTLSSTVFATTHVFAGVGVNLKFSPLDRSWQRHWNGKLVSKRNLRTLKKSRFISMVE